jgi:hypothetical protein
MPIDISHYERFAPNKLSVSHRRVSPLNSFGTRDIHGDNNGDYRDRTSPRREREERESTRRRSEVTHTQRAPRSMVDRGVFSDIFNPLTFVDEAVRSFAATQGPVDLGPDFAPGVGSVICGRGEF